MNNIRLLSFSTLLFLIHNAYSMESCLSQPELFLTDNHYRFALYTLEKGDLFVNAFSKIAQFRVSSDSWKHILDNPCDTGKLITYLYENHEQKFTSNTKSDIAIELGTPGAVQWFKNNITACSTEYASAIEKLAISVQRSFYSTAHTLLEMGIDPNATCLNGQSLIAIAIKNSDYKMFTLLTKYGAQIDFNNTKSNDYQILRKQLESSVQAEIHYKTENYVNMLIHNNVVMNIDFILRIALENRDFRTANLLFKYNANIHRTRYESFMRLLKSLTKKDKLDKMADLLRIDSGYKRLFHDTRLITAMTYPDLDMIGLLLDADAHINCLNSVGKSPLFILIDKLAEARDTNNGNVHSMLLDCLNAFLLYKEKIDLNIQYNGLTLFEYAETKGFYELSSVFFSSDSYDSDESDESGSEPTLDEDQDFSKNDSAPCTIH